MRIIFYNPVNRMFRHDGDEFTARAKDCLVYWQRQGHEVKMCPLPKANDANKRAFVRGVLDAQAEQSVDRIAVFGHGTSGWCDLGITVSTLASVVPNLDRVLTDDARIGMYCCLTGHNVVKGLAVTLSRALPCVSIMAHKSSSPWEILGGHTTDNPYKRMFRNGEYRDMWPTDKSEFKAWREELKASKTFEFELLERDVLEGWAKS